MRKYTAHVVSKEHTDKFWNVASPFLHEGLLMCEGELNIHHLRMMVANGQIILLLIQDLETDNIKGAMAIEIMNYPGFRAANILSYGGYNLFADIDDFDYLKSELKKAGISQLQGWCKPAQARLFKSKYGFKTPYEMIRVSLTEEN